jgi:carbon-monoxide dehydrogenase small subunit
MAPTPGRDSWLGPAPGPVALRGSEHGVRPAGSDPIEPAANLRPPQPATRLRVPVTTGKIEEAEGVIRLSQSFVLEHPREAVWALMSDPQAVALCMPGARLEGPAQDGRVTGRMELKLGPLVASFAGEGTVTQFPAEYRQVIEGRGTDRRSRSQVSGSIAYRLSACSGPSGGETTRVDVVIGYALTGLLAQMGRSTLARDLAQRIGETFAQNVDARLRAPSTAEMPQAPLGALPLILATIRLRLRAWLARALGT